MVGERITLEELAKRTGEPLERLRRWHSLGLIGRAEGGAFSQEDVGRSRLIHDLLHYGISLDAIVEGCREPDSLFCFFLDDSGRRLARPMYSLGEAVEAAGLETGTVRRLMEAAGMNDPAEMVDDEDLQFFAASKVALEAGYPEEALLQVLRVYADAMAKVAEVGARTSHFYLHRQVAAGHPGPGEALQKLEQAFHRIEPLIEPALLYFYRRGAARAEWDEMLMHLEEEAGLAEKLEAPGQTRQAIMFIDLASFTPLAEAMGDIKAAEVLERFSGIVRTAIRRCHGRIVKQIGDAFMLVFAEPYSAVSCALEIEQRAGQEEQFPSVRSGLHWGTVLYREGDYLGSNVNIASRLAEEAQRHQHLVTGEVWRRAREIEGVEFVRLGKRRLKGLAAEVEVFEARAVGPAGVQRVVDPVCGMELGVAEVAARLTVDGHEHAFHSDACLKKFVASPEKYA
jgi:class 3 adenylate cyclase